MTRRLSLRPQLGRVRDADEPLNVARQLALPAGLVGENRHGEGRPPRRGRPLEGGQRPPRLRIIKKIDSRPSKY